MKLFFKSILLFCFTLSLCCSCMIREEYHGKEFTNEVLNKLKIKKFTKEDVIDLLGNPSSSSIFDDDIWYYISLKKRGASLLKPKITDQKVVQLKFKNNILIEIKKYKGDKAKSFKFNKKMDVIILNQMLWYVLEELEVTMMNIYNLLDSQGYLIISMAFLERQNYGVEFIDGFDGLIKYCQEDINDKFEVIFSDFDSSKIYPYNDGLVCLKKLEV